MIKPHNSNKEEVDRAIALPLKLLTDDGREIALTSWKPSVVIGSFISVEIHGIVRIDDSMVVVE